MSDGGGTDTSKRPRQPGWYADPARGGGWRRYWDGSDWTDASAEQLAQLTRRRRRRGGVGGLLLGLALVVGVVVTSLSGHGGSATRHGTPRTRRSTPPAPAVTANAAASIADAYVAAYNARSPQRLRALLAPTFTRVVAGRSEGLNDAMTVLRSQLGAPGTPGLSFADEHVTTGPGATATVVAHYGVNLTGRRQSGTLTLHLVASGGSLLIDRMQIVPQRSVRTTAHPPPSRSSAQSRSQSSKP